MDFFALLRPLGWNESFHSQALALGMSPELLVPARITGEERSEYAIQSVNEGIRRAEVSGSYRHQNQGLPTVGDWVLGSLMPGTDRLRIQHILERRSLLRRLAPGEGNEEQLLAANVDLAFLVQGLPNDFNIARLERYLALVRDGGVEPVVVLTKSDLTPEAEKFREEAESVAGGAEVRLVSNLDGSGITELRARLAPGQTAVFLGSSGVGKSSLVNSLAGGEIQATQATGEDGRGRHTTTGRSIVRLATGALLLDTPGLREVGLWIEGDGIGAAFADITELAGNCRFGNCRHEQEPGCAVLGAIETGELDPDRLVRLRKLEREEAFLARRKDKGLLSAEKQRWKAISKGQRASYKTRGR